MGTLRNPAELAEMWQSWHENVGRPMRDDYTRMVEIANAGAKELGYADTGAMWRSQYDMTPAGILGDVRPAVERGPSRSTTSSTATPGPSSTRNTAMRSSRRPARSAPTCSAICGRRNGAISTTSSRPRARATSAMTSTELLESQEVRPGRDGQDRRGLLHLARLRAAARHLLGAQPDHPPARPRSGLPCLGLGPRQQGRPAHQDVHQGQWRRLRHHPPRAWPQLLPARLQPAALPLSERRQRRLPRGDRRLHRAVDHAANIWCRSACSTGRRCRRRTRTPACCCARRWTRSPSCRSACWSTNGAGACSTARSPRPITTRPGST